MGLIPLGLIGLGATVGAGILGAKRRAQLAEQEAKLKEEEYVRKTMTKDALERALKGDPSGVENPIFAKSVGPEMAQFITNTLATVNRQQAAEGEQRASFFGADPMAGRQSSTTIIEPATGAPRPPMTIGGPTAGDRPIDTSRPMLPSTEQPGAVETERTITVEMGGRHYLIPTIVNGQRLSPDAAIAAFQAGRNPDVGEYGTSAEAEAAAVARSKRIGQVRGLGEAPPTGLARLQGTLGEGQSVSGEMGGLKFTATGNNIAQRRAAVRAIIEGNVPYDDAVTQYVAQTGDLAGLANFGQIGDAQFMREYRGAIADSGKRLSELGVNERRQFAEQAFLTVGRIPDALKESLKFTREDESRLAFTRATSLMQKGATFPQALAIIEGSGFKLDKDDELVLGQRYYGEVLTALQQQAQERGETPNIEALKAQAALAVNNNPRLIPPEDRTAIAAFAPMDEKTRARIVEQGGRVPRLSDQPRRGAGAGAPHIAEARRQVETEEINLAGQRAGTVKQAQEDVPERPSAGAQERAIASKAADKLGEEIEAGYTKLAKNFGGPFGLKGRMTAMRAKMNQADVQAANDLRAKVSLLRSALGHELAGAAIGPAERDLYFKTFPDLDTNSDVEFKSNVKTTLGNIRRLRDARAEVEEAANLRPTGKPGGKPGGAGGAGPNEIGARERALREKYPRPGAR